MRIGALLIGSSEVTPPLKGVEKDIKNFQSYLRSNTGGAWEDHEIEIIVNKSKSYILSRVKQYSDYDFLLVLVAAHGEHQMPEDKTVFYTSDINAPFREETIALTELVASCKRQVIITDACRQRVQIKTFAESALKFERILETHETYNRLRYRQKYIDLLSKTSEGLMIFYSCDINQSAGEDLNGGAYTQSLLQVGSNSSQTLNLYEVHQTAKQITYRKNPPQTPSENVGRRRDFPPFAINLYR